MKRSSVNLNWPRPSEFPALSDREVHIWAVPLEESFPATELDKILPDAECERAGSFAFDKPRQVFVNSRVALRSLLGRYLDTPPVDVPIVIDSTGKPRLVDGDLRFNLAHSGELALIAVTKGCAVGVDVELVRPVERLLELAERNFHPDEIEAIRMVDAAQQLVVFHRCWVRKEAVLKAIGAGLSFPLTSFDSLRHSELELCVNGSATRCYLNDLAPANDYSAAIATCLPRRPAQGFTYTLEWLGCTK